MINCNTAESVGENLRVYRSKKNQQFSLYYNQVRFYPALIYLKQLFFIIIRGKTVFFHIIVTSYIRRKHGASTNKSLFLLITHSSFLRKAVDKKRWWRYRLESKILTVFEPTEGSRFQLVKTITPTWSLTRKRYINKLWC